MPRIFVSHCTEDREFVENEIVSLLRKHGLDTWYSRTDIGAATNLEQDIRTALVTCDWFLVVMSKASLASRWVKTEVHWAMEERQGRIVPVMIEPLDPSEFHLMLRQCS